MEKYNLPSDKCNIRDLIKSGEMASYILDYPSSYRLSPLTGAVSVASLYLYVYAWIDDFLFYETEILKKF